MFLSTALSYFNYNGFFHTFALKTFALKISHTFALKITPSDGMPGPGVKMQVCRSTLLENPQFFELKTKNKPIFNQQRTSTCSQERVNERKTNPTQQITRSHGYTSYLSGD
jgi:hypothetical protein